MYTRKGYETVDRSMQRAEHLTQHEWVSAMADGDMEMVTSSEPIDIRELLALTQEMSELLDQESAALKQSRVAEVESMQERKRELASALEVQKKRIVEHPEAIKSLKMPEKSKLEKAILRMTGAVQENKKRVDAARIVNRRIFELIAKAAQKFQETSNYTAFGKKAAPPKETVAIQLNQTC